MKKILFPFYKEKHEFLTEKWWFRILVVLYLLVSITSLVSAWKYQVSHRKYLCTEAIVYPRIPTDFKGRLSEYFDTPESKAEQVVVKQQEERCNSFAQAIAEPSVIIQGILIPILIYYLVQLVFFVIIVDFIVLGNKKRE